MIAPSVAVPTSMIAAVLMPARMGPVAIGSSTRTSLAQAESPSASADSRSDGGMPTIPAVVLRTMGSRL